jgi:hypothetical protein
MLLGVLFKHFSDLSHKKKYFPELPSEVQRNLPSTPKQTLTQPGPLKTLKRHRVSTPTRRLGIRNLSRNGLRYVSTRSASTRTYASTLPWNNQSPVHNQSTNSMDTAGGSSLPSASCPDGRKRRVCYYYDSVTANVDYGPEHGMVPRRVDMAHALVRSYGLLSDMRRQGRLYIFLKAPGVSHCLGPLSYTNINYIQIFYIYKSFIKNSTKILKLI